ncbi:MAG: LysR family transcriptional regulator [Firmicutes bacterium]|nr:LysR family transcriptional regulator [Bacillota bacterium]
MEIRNLTTFLKVAVLGSFTQAARDLGYSQANVSAQIKQLEEEVGAPLFNRIGRSITLTQYAEELLPYARSIVATASQVENLLRPEEELGGTLRVGMIESLFDLLAEEVLPAYHRRFPRVLLEVTVDSTEALKDALAHGRIDIACLIDDPLPKNEWQVLFAAESEIAAYAAPSHPLAGKKHVTAAMLAAHETILMERSAPYNSGLRSFLAKSEIELVPFLTLQRSDMARKLTEHGPYITVLPRYSVAEALAAGRLVKLDTEGLQIHETVQVVLQRDRVIVPQIKGFAELASARIQAVLSAADQ